MMEKPIITDEEYTSSMNTFENLEFWAEGIYYFILNRKYSPSGLLVQMAYEAHQVFPVIKNVFDLLVKDFPEFSSSAVNQGASQSIFLPGISEDQGEFFNEALLQQGKDHITPDEFMCVISFYAHAYSTIHQMMVSLAAADQEYNLMTVFVVACLDIGKALVEAKTEQIRQRDQEEAELCEK
jgi:hypothetical protein